MGLLKKEPAGRIASAEELMAVAHELEREAARRYRDLSDRMRIQGEEGLSGLFAFLAVVEDKHAHQVDERARKIIGRAPDPTTIRWELPENFDEAAGRSALLTPYRALAIAVRNEERAFAFYAYLAAGTDDEALRRLAEDFAKDELDHAALLRRERRKAWRRDESRDPFRGSRDIPASLGEFCAQAAGLEQAAAEGHRSLASDLRAKGDAATAGLFEWAAGDELASAASLSARAAGQGDVSLAVHPVSVRDGLRIMEFAFEIYSDIVEQTQDETVMQEAQAMSKRALARLARVQGTIGNTLLGAAAATPN